MNEAINPISLETIVSSLSQGYFSSESTTCNEGQCSTVCHISEESDLYAFSLVDNSRVCSEDVLDSFRSDTNWCNPGSVALMRNAFGITDDYASPFIPVATGPTYLDLRAKHNHMLASRSFEIKETFRKVKK